MNKINDQMFGTGVKVSLGTNFTIIAISKIEGNFYSSFTNGTMTAGYFKDLDFTPSFLCS